MPNLSLLRSIFDFGSGTEQTIDGNQYTMPSPYGAGATPSGGCCSKATRQVCIIIIISDVNGTCCSNCISSITTVCHRPRLHLSVNKTKVNLTGSHFYDCSLSLRGWKLTRVIPQMCAFSLFILHFPFLLLSKRLSSLRSNYWHCMQVTATVCESLTWEMSA